MRRLALALTLGPLALAACRPAASDDALTPEEQAEESAEVWQSETAVYQAFKDLYARRGDALGADTLANVGMALAMGVTQPGPGGAPLVLPDTATGLRLLRRASARGSAQASLHLRFFSMRARDTVQQRRWGSLAVRQGDAGAATQMITEYLLHGPSDSLRAILAERSRHPHVQAASDTLLATFDANAAKGVAEAQAMADTLRAALAPSRWPDASPRPCPDPGAARPRRVPPRGLGRRPHAGGAGGGTC